MLLKMQSLRHQVANNKKSILSNEKYLSHTYSDSVAPPSQYPDLLAKWLLENVFYRPGKIADFGCGRGDFLRAFKSLEFEPHGLDISPNIKNLSEFNVKQVDFINDDVPYTDEKYDFIFSKSVIEHLREPTPYFSAIYEGLKEDGKAVVMVPSWAHTYWGPFYIDYTHVTPFTAKSLKDALEMAGFENVSVRYFYQLPVVWKYPWLKPLIQIFSKLPLPYAPYNDVPWQTSNKFNKLIRFSKEVMLIAIVEK
tara:strand:+ start:1976 stop:2731 length:756 start_codon:yes stop_codon:yes gene_type:complete